LIILAADLCLTIVCHDVYTYLSKYTIEPDS